MNFKLDEQGVLIDPDFHDGTVAAVDVSDDQCAKITLTTVAGDWYQVDLSGLKHLRCDDFREGNIIFDVSVFSKTVPPKHTLCHLLGLQVQEESQYLSAIVRSIEIGDLCLFSVSPSYGCELYALCRSIQLRELREGRQ